MTAKLSISRVGDIFFAFSAVMVLAMIPLANQGGQFLLVPAQVMLCLGILGAGLGGCRRREMPWVRVQFALVLFLLLNIIGPIVMSAFSVRSFRMCR